MAVTLATPVFARPFSIQGLDPFSAQEGEPMLMHCALAVLHDIVRWEFFQEAKRGGKNWSAAMDRAVTMSYDLAEKVIAEYNVRESA